MFLTPVRRRLAALSMVLLVPVIGGCGFGGFAGNEYQTDQVYQPGVGINNRSGTVDILAAAVVSGAKGSGTFIASLANKSSTKTATLTGITGPEGVKVQLVKSVEVGPGDLVNLADEGAVAVSGDAIEAGGFVKLTLEFDTGQTSSVNATIVARTQEYALVPPAIPSASPSASASESPSASASAPASAPASESPAP